MIFTYEDFDGLYLFGTFQYYSINSANLNNCSCTNFDKSKREGIASVFDHNIGHKYFIFDYDFIFDSMYKLKGHKNSNKTIS